MTGRRVLIVVPRSPLADRLQVAPVLDVDRLVEAVLLLDLPDRLRRRPLTEQRLGGTGRQSPDPEEDQDREPEQDRDEQDQPADDEAEPRFSSPAGCLLGTPGYSLPPPIETVLKSSFVVGLGTKPSMSEPEGQRRLGVRVRDGGQRVP